MARVVEQHKTKPAKRTSRRRSRSSQNNPSKTKQSPWLSTDDLFRRWRARLESSQETVGEVEALLRNRETRSAFVNGPCLFGGGVPPHGWVAWLPSDPASSVVLSYFYAGASECGEPWILDSEFWRDMAYLEVVPDADGVGDRLEVRRPTYVNADGPFSDSPGGTFLVRRIDVEHWEAALPTAPTKERKPVPKKKRRKAKQAFRSGAPEQHDWEEGELFVMQQLETRGNPLDKNNQTKGWKTIHLTLRRYARR